MSIKAACSHLPISDGRPVLGILRDKHPEGQPLEPNCIQSQHPRTLPYHPAVFDKISARLLRRHAMNTHGSAGPSGLDADDWRRLLSAFGQTSTNLCKLVAKFAKRLATSIIPPDDLIAYNGCRLVALDKCPGVRSIGIGEVMRRITGRLIVDFIRQDLSSLDENMQLCLGQKCGIEHAIYLLPYRIPIAIRLISTSVSRPFCLREVRHKAIPLRWQCMELQSHP